MNFLGGNKKVPEARVFNSHYPAWGSGGGFNFQGGNLKLQLGSGIGISGGRHHRASIQAGCIAHQAWPRSQEFELEEGAARDWHLQEAHRLASGLGMSA